MTSSSRTPRAVASAAAATASRPASSGRGEISLPSRRSMLSTRRGVVPPLASSSSSGASAVSDSVPTTLRATPAPASSAARSQVVAPASTHGSATVASADSVATSAGSPASASRSATYRVLVRQTAHSARATATGSHPSTSGLCSGAYSARWPRRACTTTPPLRSRTGTIRIGCPQTLVSRAQLRHRGRVDEPGDVQPPGTQARDVLARFGRDGVPPRLGGLLGPRRQVVEELLGGLDVDQIAHAEADVPPLVALDALHALAHPGQHTVLQVLEQRALPGGEHVPLEDHVVQGDALIQSDLAC